jgi:hypothetical protein
LTIREAPVTETQKQPDPNHACHRNGMAHRLERIERDVADIKAALVTKSMPQQPTVSPRADGRGQSSAAEPSASATSRSRRHAGETVRLDNRPREDQAEGFAAGRRSRRLVELDP